MERDFLGLNSTEGLAAVKQEITEEETPWPFMKKASSFPHFMPVQSGAGKDDGMNHMVSDGFDRGKKSSKGEIQNFPIAVSNSPVNPSFASSGQNVLDAIMRQQFQGAPETATSPTGQVGFTEPWSSLKSSAAPGQMTIFYAGTISVCDGITPEMAQAIMLLAGNASFLASNMKHPTAPVDKAPSTTVVDRAISQAGPVPAANDEPAAGSKHEHVTLGGPIPMPATSMLPSAVPQFRKASLARFLEKRKERVKSNAPYSSCAKKQEGDIVAENTNVGCALPSAANSGTSPAAA